MMSANSVVLARIRQGENGVFGADHAEVAVARLDGMDELRRRAGRGEGRGDLAGDMAALAHAGDDDAPARRGASVDRSFESTVERFGEAFEPGDLGADDASGNGEVACRSPVALSRIALPGHAGTDRSSRPDDPFGSQTSDCPLPRHGAC